MNPGDHHRGAPRRVSKPASPFGNGGILHNRDHAICDNAGASERTRDTSPLADVSVKVPVVVDGGIPPIVMSNTNPAVNRPKWVA